jgi:hypothetical protein
VKAKKVEWIISFLYLLLEPSLLSSFIRPLPSANIVFISLSQIESLDADEDPIFTAFATNLPPLIEATAAFHNG